eukprot:3053178-Pleurochrysis_carterae.AAC.2
MQVRHHPLVAHREDLDVITSSLKSRGGPVAILSPFLSEVQTELLKRASAGCDVAVNAVASMHALARTADEALRAGARAAAQPCVAPLASPLPSPLAVSGDSTAKGDVARQSDDRGRLPSQEAAPLQSGDGAVSHTETLRAHALSVESQRLPSPPPLPTPPSTPSSPPPLPQPSPPPLSSPSAPPVGPLGAPQPLPIDSARASLLRALRASRVVVVRGGTGCGKTTRVPQMLADTQGANGVRADA